MSVPAWINSSDWHTLILDGQVFPGIWKVELNLPVEIDIQKGKGTKKARLKDEGDQPAKLTIKGKLGQKGKEQEEVDELSKLLPIIRSKATKAGRAAHTIQHPNANFWGISKIVLGTVRSQNPDPVDGWEIEIEAFEWVAAPKKLKATKPVDQEEENRKAWAQFQKQKPDTSPLMSGGSQMSGGGPNASYAPSSGAPAAAPAQNSSPSDNMYPNSSQTDGGWNP